MARFSPESFTVYKADTGAGSTPTDPESSSTESSKPSKIRSNKYTEHNQSLVDQANREQNPEIIYPDEP